MAKNLVRFTTTFEFDRKYGIRRVSMLGC